MKRLTALLLCICMVFSLFSCAAEPEPTIAPTEPPTEAPTEPPVSDLYLQAYNLSAASEKLMMEITSSQTTVIGGAELKQTCDQTLFYTGFGTEDMAYRSTEAITYGDVLTYTYDETYISGMLYVCLDYTDRFSGTVTVDEAAQRYLNPLMLDASLYGSITQSEDGTFHFESPTSAESWAMPEGAEMLEARGEATIGSDGKLQNLGYTIRYAYGPAEVTLEVDAVVTFGPTTINVPTEASKYLLVQDVDAVYLSNNAAGMLFTSPSVTTSTIESVMSQAAAVMRNQSNTINLHMADTGLSAKVDTSIYLMDYNTGKPQQMEQEQTYLDGAYTIVVDDGAPETVPGVTASDVGNMCVQLMGANIIRYDFWRDAEIIDLGSTWLIELVLNDDFADAMEGAICSSFWNDSRFLKNLASNYNLAASTGYIGIDKYSGLPTSAGFYYEAAHTIEGQPYTLSMQSDQSIDAASMESSYNITEELLPEEEPEAKATPLFYHVTGADGQEMWLMGTIHVGDERTGFLPQQVYDAFAASDALALEFDSEAFEEAAEEDDKLQEEVSAAYYYDDGTQVRDHVDPETYEAAVRYLKAAGGYNMNAPYLKPSMWSNTIENFYLRQGYSLTGSQGMEERLTKLAHEQDKPIYDVESGLFQVKMLTGWSEELHALLLADALSGNAEEYFTDVQELYELWCAGDEAALRKELSDEVDLRELTEEEKAEYEEIKHLMEEYNKAMSYDRNDGMLQKAIEYLESGETVFYAVGLAHLLNNVNGLVDALRDAGYTVELVAYAD